MPKLGDQAYKIRDANAAINMTRRFLLVWSLTIIAIGHAIKTPSVNMLITSKDICRARYAVVSFRAVGI